MAKAKARPVMAKAKARPVTAKAKVTAKARGKTNVFLLPVATWLAGPVFVTTSTVPPAWSGRNENRHREQHTHDREAADK